MKEKKLTEREMAQQFRELMERAAPSMRETNRAEAFAYALSWRSTLFRERHAWVETSKTGALRVELEDWENETDEWDNAYARVTVDSLEDAVELTQDWLCGNSLQHKYMNLNKSYDKVTKLTLVPQVPQVPQVTLPPSPAFSGRERVLVLQP